MSTRIVSYAKIGKAELIQAISVMIEKKKGTGIPKLLRELRQNGSLEPEFDMDEDRTYLKRFSREYLLLADAL